jgi:hypothetical protein
MAKRKIPSQASSGAETFNDFLVGRQLTDGTSALTNTVFALDKVIPQKDSKTFKTNPFSEFLTLETLKENNGVDLRAPSSKKKTNEIRFRGNKKYGDKSLFGSLSSRILVSITRIIEKFPGGLSIVQDNPIGVSPFNVNNISYDDSLNITTFSIERSKLFNPFEIVLVEPNSVIKPQTENELRNFYSSFKQYILEIDKTPYPIIEYTQPNNFNSIELKVTGKPFTGTTYSNNILIRPNDGIVEEFFLGLDDLEESLLNRETSPIYTSSFKVPKDNTDGSKTSLVDVNITWPVGGDNYNIQILGIDFDSYVLRLKDIANEIDNFKSNLTVRFLSAPQLFEFDTEDKRAESIFQLYGQSFDSVKKYIDNISNMRNVSYDKINNIPDVLLKNLAENLGLSTINLFDQKKLDEILYSRIESNYDGIPTGMNLIDAEYEFYRRLLVNLSYIYKSKGTKSSIDFFLKFIGAPEPLIRIDEYVYKVTSIPSSFDLQKDIYDVIQGNKVFTYAIFNENTFTYEQVSFTASTTYNREGYPVDEVTGLPRRAFNETEGIFFQKGSGWYDETLSHRSSLILDEENSSLTGRTKTIVTKNKPYSYGEEYFEQFRTLPGLETGFGLELSIDNGKSQQIEDNSILILNRKNIGIYISPSRGVDYDIFRQTKELEISFGTNTLNPQTGKTFAEFLDTFIHTLVTNSNKIRYKKNYIQLEDVYRDYMSYTTGFTPYHQIDVSEFIDRVSPYWPQLVEQLVPSTTLWTGGNLIENNVFGRPKFQYKYDCQPLQFIEDLYPEFENIIHNDLINILGEENNFRTLLKLTGMTYFPIIEIDGVIYGGTDYENLTPSMSVVVSGVTNTTNSAKLFDPQPLTGCTSGVTSNDVTNLSLICDYKDYLSPDTDKIKELWVDALNELISSIVITRNSAGYEPYGPFTGTTGQTFYSEEVPLINSEIYTDENGVEKIRFSSIKLGPNECSVSNYFDYRFEADYDTIKNTNGFSVHVYGDNQSYCDTPSGCTYSTDLYIDVIGYKTGIQKGSDWPFNIYANCVSGYNENADVYIEKINDCLYKITGFTENDVINFNILDAANNESKFRIDGLQIKIEHDPCPEPNGKSHIEMFELVGYQGTTGDTISIMTGVTYCDNYTGYTVQPKVTYMSNYNHGLKCDSTVLVVDSGLTINETTTYLDIENYITGGTITKKVVCDLTIGEYVLSAVNLPCSQFTHQQIVNGHETGYSFVYNYNMLEITNIDCLTSIKKSIITGQTKNGDFEVFEVLPTTELRVYTNKIVDNFGDPINTTYFFDDRFPEELQLKPSDIIEPCCPHPKELYKNGDFMINQYGNLIEVISVDLDYCESNLYFNLNLNLNGNPINNEDVIIFNGNNDTQLLLSHKYTNHPNNNFNLGQYYIDENHCPDEPTDEELSTPIFECL